MKAEWLSAYIAAHQKAFSIKNIHAGWSAAGLLPFNPSKVIDRCPANKFNRDQIRPQTPTTASPFAQSMLNSSPSDAVALHAGKTVLLEMINANEALNTPAKMWVKQLTTSTERLFA